MSALWTIVEEGAADFERRGSSFLVGNGCLGYRGTLEEDGKDRLTALIVSGLYDRAGSLWREPVNLPNPLSVRVLYGGRLLDARTWKVEHSQSLDLRRAAHTRRSVFTTEDGVRIKVEAVRFASLSRLRLLCTRYTLEASADCEVLVRAGIDGDVWDINGPHLSGFTASEGVVSSMTCRTGEAGLPIAVCHHAAADAAENEFIQDGLWCGRRMRVPLRAGSPWTMDVTASVCTGMDAEDPHAAAREECASGARIGFDALYGAHRASWEERWAAASVEIKGDAQAELALRFSSYHLMSIVPAHTEKASIPARGLSGQMYKGAIFWDTEIFMLPFFLHTDPRAARSLLMYRRHTLDGARRKAREYGRRGAFYAWESQDSGDDACTLFNVTDVLTGRPVRTYFRDKQIHISADIPYAISRYIQATGDRTILLDGGAEVIYECARFLLSCLYFSPERGRYELLDVTGPDEYHERVHNNAYTNWMTALAFDACLETAEDLERRHPAEARALLDALDFRRDLEAIRRARPLLYTPEPDPRTLVVPQFDGYLALEDATVEVVQGRRLHPDEYLGGAGGVASSTQVIKQADVVLGLVLGDGFSTEVKAANWTYYEPRTEHGSSLSAAAYALAAAETGRVEEAYRYFMKAAEVDLRGESKSRVGTLYIGGTHPASAGGAWMAAVFGLCGIRVRGSAITLAPRLPAAWREARVPLVVRGRRLVFTVSAREASVESLSAGGEELSLLAGGRVHPLPAGGRLAIALEAGQ